jgi:predicted MPP superfamily phosphohydrolase
MVLQKLVTWMRNEARHAPVKHRLARWVGRNWARLSYAVHVEPTWLEVNRHDIFVDDLPADFDGLRIVQMSDFHCGGHVTPAYLQEAIELAHAEKPDVIVLTGDFIHKGFDHVERVARVLGRLEAPLGVFAVLGNHDFSVRNALGIRRHKHLHRAVADALRRCGIKVLQNETHVLERRQHLLYLAGVDDLWSRVCDPERALAGLSDKVPRIVLAHNPCTIERLNGHRCDLMLSGHTHGGQINLPGLGRVTLGPNGRRYAAGMYRYRQSLLYVNKGVGFGFRVRFGVRPEVAVFTLRTR